MASPTFTCDRCGIKRLSRTGFIPSTCRDCKFTNAKTTDADAFQGRRVRVGLVWKFIPDTEPVRLADPCHCGDYKTPGRSCETCLLWAEKDARLHEEARMSRANRHVVWAILDARKEREDAA